LSLLLERPPGREAYPGDIFYVQTQLMERAGKFNDLHGKGSVTFLGIAETLQGDLTGYIPSNLVSMCDGQVCLNSSIFAEGFRPAIDIGISLSIVGTRTQLPILKKLGGAMRSDYARYNEIIKLSKLSTGLSEEAARLMKRGEAIKSILQQSEFAPVSVAEDVLLLYALTRTEFLDLKAADKVKVAEEIFKFAMERNQPFVDNLQQANELTADISEGIKEIFDAFFAVFKKEE
jgi:F-type H+-transporting ATPase subunit alpha